MDTVLIICIIGLAILQIIMIIKFFQIANDVRILRIDSEPDSSSRKDLDKIFFAYVMAGENNKAKILLFEEISNAREFGELLSGIGSNYFQKNCDILNDRYKRHLNALGMQEIDFSLIKK